MFIGFQLKNLPRITNSHHLFRRYLKLFCFIALLAVLFYIFRFFSLFSNVVTMIKNMEESCRSSSIKDSIPVPPFKTRVDLGRILEYERMQYGVELGVQRGLFAQQILERWHNAKKYVLVDLWRFQNNYEDAANKNDTIQQSYKQEALRRTDKYRKNGVTIDTCHGSTDECADKYADDTFDFIYVDARHDYKGITHDLSRWWPKLRSGAIIAGHDYVYNNDGPMQTNQNWSVNFDGTVDPTGRAVKGAVDDFFNRKGLQVSVSYREKGFNTWAVRKPGKHPYLAQLAIHNHLQI